MSPAVSRLAALLVLAIALLVGWGVTVEPYRALLAAQDEALAERRERLERLTRIAGGVPALTRALDTVAAAPVAGDPYLSGASDPLAAAALHGLLGRLAEQAGVAVSMVTPVAATDAREAGRIALSVGASGPLDGVQRLLHAVETERPLLFVEELELVNPSTTATQLAPSGQPMVSVRLRVAGYRRAP